MDTTQIIELLREYHAQDAQIFDFNASMLLSGNHNKERRREIIKLVTGEHRPISKCTMYACIDTLKNSFNQIALF